ncbi:MAG: hypothetical protein A3G93_16090 [Nitrospinae bacterium RIFCSPLOWO2_12_FULL_45_22]|nr:MAG: hypothetical protein A3G93_16090 [Nitrospinae bacterium RIFCSPLOWO2_12_FULL_45_22]
MYFLSRTFVNNFFAKEQVDKKYLICERSELTRKMYLWPFIEVLKLEYKTKKPYLLKKFSLASHYLVCITFYPTRIFQ